MLSLKHFIEALKGFKKFQLDFVDHAMNDTIQTGALWEEYDVTKRAYDEQFKVMGFGSVVYIGKGRYIVMLEEEDETNSR